MVSTSYGGAVGVRRRRPATRHLAPAPDSRDHAEHAGGEGHADQVRDAPAARAREGSPHFDVAAAYDEHARALYAFAVNALGDRGAAEEVVQETFVRAWRARQRYGGDRGSVRTWLFAIARNMVVDTHRARARRPQLVDASRVEEPAASGDRYSQSLDRIVVVEALARLSDEHRQVVVDVHLSGASYDEVSRATGVPTATLRTRMYYGLKALRRVLDEGGDDRAAGR